MYNCMNKIFVKEVNYINYNCLKYESLDCKICKGCYCDFV